MQNQSRLKIWVCEYISAGGLASSPLPASLLHEGLLMRDALLADLHALGVDCITTHDIRVAAPEHAQSIAISPDNPSLTSVWQQQWDTHSVDACWVIAPETDGCLAQMQSLVTAHGLRWIGCDTEAIRLCTDKAAMAERCASAGIRVIPHIALASATPETLARNSNQHGWVVKPVDGAGCEHTYYFNNDFQVIEFKNKLKNNYSEFPQDFLVQPYIQGQPLSMSVLATEDDVNVLAGHQQYIVLDHNTLSFQGAGVNAAAHQRLPMQQLAEQIKRAIPGLNGCWGADLIETEGHDWVLVEINPRLTTPYIGLSKLMAENPAGLVLDAILKQQLSPAIAHGQLAIVSALDEVSHG